MQQNITLSTDSLIKYTIFSVLFAAVMLITIILPAEYNIDPTGIGHQLGLTVFNNEKTETPVQANTQESSSATKSATETIEVIIPAGRGVEYKFVMAQHQKIEYQWVTDGAVLYFDLHGEPEGDKTGYFESYAIATLAEMKGSFTTPFSGVHGWYWKNKSDVPVTVKLIVKGEYSSHSLKQ